MEAPSRVRLGHSPHSSQGASRWELEDCFTFCLAGHSVSPVSSNRWVTVTAMTADLALVIYKVFPGHHHPLRELGFIPPILQVRKLSLERL